MISSSFLFNSVSFISIYSRILSTSLSISAIISLFFFSSQFNISIFLYLDSLRWVNEDIFSSINSISISSNLEAKYSVCWISYSNLAAIFSLCFSISSFYFSISDNFCSKALIYSLSSMFSSSKLLSVSSNFSMVDLLTTFSVIKIASPLFSCY